LSGCITAWRAKRRQVITGSAACIADCCRKTRLDRFVAYQQAVSDVLPVGDAVFIRQLTDELCRLSGHFESLMAVEANRSGDSPVVQNVA